MDCPNGCGAMHSTNYRNVLIDVCPESIGVWLGPDELCLIANQPTPNWPIPAIEAVLANVGKPGVPAAERARGFECPECDETLEPTNYEGASGIIIDSCTAGHGYWLEGGEMGQLQIYTAYLQNSQTVSQPMATEAQTQTPAQTQADIA